MVASRAIALWSAAVHGGAAGVRLYRMRAMSGPGVWIQLPLLDHRIHVRPGTEDVGSVIDNVLRREYGQLPADFAPKVVVDAGAYIGDTASYFLSRFPHARVIAIEPNEENHGIARENLAAYGKRATLLKCALWRTTGSVAISGRQTSCMVIDGDGDVPALSVPALLELAEITHVDLMKMDIEGAEVEVLRSGVGGWLRQVRWLLVETHGSEIEAIVIPMLEAEGFSITRHRNVWYCLRSGCFE